MSQVNKIMLKNMMPYAYGKNIKINNILKITIF